MTSNPFAPADAEQDSTVESARSNQWDAFRLSDAAGPLVFAPCVLFLVSAHADKTRLIVVLAVQLVMLTIHVPALMMARNAPSQSMRLQESWAGTVALTMAALPWIVQARPTAAFPFALIIVALVAFDTMYMSLRNSTWWRHFLLLEIASYALWLAMQGQVALTIGVAAFGLHMLDGQRGIGRVLSALRREREQSEILANTDPLTGLANRRGLGEEMLRHVSDARHRPGSEGDITLAVIDIDNFKQVNDRFGHEEGDRTLQSIARRMADILGSEWSVARTGGDEFMAVTVDGQIVELQKLKAELAAHTQPVGQRAVHLSIGVASGLPSNDLISDASEAVHQAKILGKNQIVVVDPELRDRIRSDRRLTTRLPAALKNGEISMWAQPIVDTEAGETFGYECLARWHEPDGSAVGPDVFIPLVSKAGLMDEMGELAMRRAAEFAARLPGDIKVTVNISAGHFLSEGFLSRLTALVAETKVEPKWLIIEITESEGLGNAAQTIAVAREVRRLGFGLAVDDFGSGYSSVERLIALPLSHLKIDRVLVQTCTHEATRHLLAGVTHFASKAGVYVIAEGVESIGQEEALSQLGLHLRQGFLYGRPAPMQQIIESLSAQARAPIAAGLARNDRSPLSEPGVLAPSEIDLIP